MANPFLEKGSDELETAIIYGKAKVTDIGNAVAYTDGKRLFINTDENLMKILPAYNEGMLKWLLWHEHFHIELRHPERYERFRKSLERMGLSEEYVDKLASLPTVAKHVDRVATTFNLTHQEVNIIMDILVHDSLSKMFPDLIDTAIANLAQMRNRNSLRYTFKTHNLEDMLQEYSDYKRDANKDDSGEGEGKAEETEEKKGESGEGEGKGEGIGDKKSETERKEEKDPEDETKHGKSKDTKDTGDKEANASAKGHGEGGETPGDEAHKSEDGEPEIAEDAEKPESESEPVPEPEHDKTDWSKLDSLDSKEFIDEDEANVYENAINRLKQKKLKIGRLTQRLNGLASTKRDRTYRLPSMLQTGDGCIFKGKTAGRVELYLVFDASGSMSGEMNTFKEIITKSIPQALNCPCEWFAGWVTSKCKVKPYKTAKDDVGCTEDYYKGTYKDFLPIHASGGYCDDGDRVIELCYLAEQKGYSPIGVTDGGGRISWSSDMLKKLKRTVLVGQNSHWLARAKEINPSIQTLDI